MAERYTDVRRARIILAGLVLAVVLPLTLTVSRCLRGVNVFDGLTLLVLVAALVGAALLYSQRTS